MSAAGCRMGSRRGLVCGLVDSPVGQRPAAEPLQPRMRYRASRGGPPTPRPAGEALLAVRLPCKQETAGSRPVPSSRVEMPVSVAHGRLGPVQRPSRQSLEDRPSVSATRFPVPVV